MIAPTDPDALIAAARAAREHAYSPYSHFRVGAAVLTADGQLLGTLGGGQTVSVRRAAVSFELVKVPGRTYYQTLRDKLRWGTAPNYRTEPPAD